MRFFKIYYYYDYAIHIYTAVQTCTHNKSDTTNNSKNNNNNTIEYNKERKKHENFLQNQFL